MLQEDLDDISTESAGYSEPRPASEIRLSSALSVGQSEESSYPSSEYFLGVPKKRKEIRVHHSVHDRLQVESNLTFDLRPRSEEEKYRDFKVDMYLYLPLSMGVNSSTFVSDEYFRHTTSYFRVRTPLYNHLRSLEPKDFSFDSVEEYFAGNLSSIERSRLRGKVVQDVKLFGNFLYTELKKLRGAFSGKKRGLKESRRQEMAETLIHRTELLWAFRERYVKPIRQERYLVDDEVARAFYLTDEYLSYRLELVLLKANEVVKQEAARWDGYLRREIAYRTERKLLVLGQNGKESVAFEAYTYRLGLLKKYLGEVLFLQLTSNKKDNLYRNYAAAVGAGIAATIAGLAEQQRVQYMTGNDSGVRLAILIGIAVVAYIFKDRVKDLSKEYFNTRLKERLPDQRFAIAHRSFDNEGQEKTRNLGTVSEYFRFLRKIPSDVAYLRTLGQMTTNDPERRENVVHIGRRLRFGLRSKQHRRMFPLVKNVLRIDISPFLSKLDNPTMPVSFVGEEGLSTTVQAPKVYHLNMVVRYEVGFDTESGERLVDYERFRLIVNKNGIVRLERLLELGRLGYEAESE